MDKLLRRIRKNLIVLIFFSLFLAALCFSQNQPFVSISAKDHPGFTRVIIQLSSILPFSVEKSGALLMIEVKTRIPLGIQRKSFESRFIESFSWTRRNNSLILTIKANHGNFSYDYFTIGYPPKLIIDLREVQEEQKAVRTIVIDPGHGGLESGAKGKFGTLEKEVTLGISLRLKTVIERNLAYRVVLTRDRDIDKALDDRAALANNNKADLFVSIHANSSYRKNARGSETYFLSLNATDEEARRLAYLENSSAQLEERIEGDNQDEIKMILWDMAQAAYLHQSSRLAELIQSELNVLLRTANRGIKQAPFKVLTGVACPAVLVEVAFISNPVEEKELGTEEFQYKVAEAVYQGIAKFLRRYSQ
ncbi:MAG: N-acetylmuramoyl-L-alanine amidase [Candidatus Aminicenantaceae bacterium]